MYIIGRHQTQVNGIFGHLLTRVLLDPAMIKENNLNGAYTLVRFGFQNVLCQLLP